VAAEVSMAAATVLTLIAATMMAVATATVTTLACSGVRRCAARSGMATTKCGSSLLVVVVGRWRGRKRRAAATELYGAQWQGGERSALFLG
jgi:hypothetical protein